MMELVKLNIIVRTHIGTLRLQTRVNRFMDQKGTSAGYTSTAKTLHWLIVALLIGQFIFAWTMPDIRRDTPVTTLISLHFTFGVLILAVAIVRLGWRLTHGEPDPEDGVPPWQNASARVVHWLLYLLLFVVPILGWINASWRGMPIVMFGMELPKLIATHAAGWGWTGDVHGLLANYLLLALVGLHVVAALYHRFIRGDGVLQRMLPGA
jgi:cytochrome b561